MKTTTHQVTIPEPPEHLSERSKHLWREIAPNEARTIERQTLFQAALECLDRADEARRIVQEEGLTTKTATTGAVHIHPAVRVEREARAQFVKIWSGVLNLQWNGEIKGISPIGLI